MTRTAAGARSIHVGRAVLGESAVIAAILALIDARPAGHLGWSAAAVALATLAFARWRHDYLLAWLVNAAGFATRRHTLTVPIEPDCTMITVVELGDLDAHVTTAVTPLPDLATLLRPGDAGSPTVQPLVVTGAAYRQVFLVVRIDAAARGALPGTLRRIGRRLDSIGVAHRAAELRTAIRAAYGTEPVQEAWSHLAVGSEVQATLRVQLGVAGMTGDLLVRLTGQAPVTTVLTWSDVDATIRVIARSAAELDSAIAHIVTSCGKRAERLDGRHLPAMLATLPLGLVGRTTAPPGIVSMTAAARRSAEPGANQLMLGPAGLLIGHDRYGQQVRIRVPLDRDKPLRVVVAGGVAAARLLTARGRASGVPVVVSVVSQPTASDATSLASADVVICHAMPAEHATVVSTALGLTQAGTWLSRIRHDMVAVISDGIVRWALLPAGTVESQRITGLAGVART